VSFNSTTDGLFPVKDRYGEASVKAPCKSSDDTSSSEDDEHAEQLTQQLEKDFFKTLSCLKKKDASIYDEKVSFFADINSTEPQGQNVGIKKSDKKPLFLRDYERKLIVEHKGQLVDGGKLILLQRSP
jgi:protein KRI1